MLALTSALDLGAAGEVEEPEPNIDMMCRK